MANLEFKITMECYHKNKINNCASRDLNNYPISKYIVKGHYLVKREGQLICKFCSLKFNQTCQNNCKKTQVPAFNSKGVLYTFDFVCTCLNTLD